MRTFKHCRRNVFLVCKNTGNVESKQNNGSVTEWVLLASIYKTRNFFVSDSKCAVFTNIEIDERKGHLHSFSEIRKSLL